MPQNSIGIQGTRERGEDIRTNNTTAASAIANIVKTSLGPQGLDKMIVDQVGQVVVTNDGATILRKLEVEHPAAKLLVQLSQLQDAQVGDGTTSVVIIAAELLKKANQLIKQKVNQNKQVHPTCIIAGFKIAAKQACRYIENNLSLMVQTLGSQALLNCAKTSMSSKLIGADKEFFAKLIIDAINYVKLQGPLGPRFPIKAINILKSHGQSSIQSRLIKGYSIRNMKSHQLMPSKVLKAKIACLDMNLQKFRLQMGVQVLIDDPKNLEQIRQHQCNVVKERIQKILKAGANVIITSMGLDQMAGKYLLQVGALGIRRVQKRDLNKIAKLVGATIVNTMATPQGEQVFQQQNLGYCEQVYQQAVGDNDFIFFQGCQKSNACTIIVRGANQFMCQQIERSIHDTICVAKRTLQSGCVVPGGGACEIALGIYLEKFAEEYDNKEQIAIAQFAEALTIVPKVLANNAAKDSADLISKLRALHSAAQSNPNDEKKGQLKYCGLDLVNGKPANNLKMGVLQPTISKIKSIRFATEAAITILRIDDMIKLDPKKEQREPPH